MRSKFELEKIPTVHDPWGILQSTPEVLTDRINVGDDGTSRYASPGSSGEQVVWEILSPRVRFGARLNFR